MNDSLAAIPITAKSRPALCSTSAFRYKFPASARQSIEGMGVAESAEALLHGFQILRTCVMTLAGALMKIGPLELKIELAHHLHHYAQGAQAIRARLGELRVSTKELECAVPAWMHNASCTLVGQDNPIVFVICFREILERPLRERLAEHLRCIDPLLDYPSIRMLRPVMMDLAAADDWYSQIEAAAIDAGDDPLVWSQPLAALKRSLKRWCDDELSGRDVARMHVVRGHVCQRDDRLPVFHQTRQYRSDDLKPHALPSELARACVELFRVQRDELDAVETFANVIFDMRPPFELELLLARIVSDEARHAEMGQQNLQRMGLDPFTVPCGVIGINVRSPLPPLVALAQISIFGELNQLSGLRKLSDHCDAAGDSQSARAFDFTHADELMHLRQVRSWLPQLARATGLSMSELEEVARQHAIDRLRQEGVVGEDYANGITSDQLSLLIGE